MGLLGWATGGASGLGPSSMYQDPGRGQALPYSGYRSIGTWLEEWVDAIGIEFDIRKQRFISATARANMLDPTYNTLEATDSYLASATAAPLLAAVKDSVLDVLTYVAGIPFPTDTNLSVAQRQLLASKGWDAMRRKGTRARILNLAAQLFNGQVVGVSTPPYNFSIIVPDGEASPGWGSWVSGGTAKTGTVAVTINSTAVVGTSTKFTTDYSTNQIFSTDNATWYIISAIADDTHLTLYSNYLGPTASGLTPYGMAVETSRPWIFQAVRNVASRTFPAWSSVAIGPSVFTAGFSAAGEPCGDNSNLSRVNLLKNGSFTTWSSSKPDSWTQAGTLSLLVRAANPAYCNLEFTPCAAQFNLSTAAIGLYCNLSQTANINNQVNHQVEVDYQYTNPASVAVLTLQVYDVTNAMYYNPTSQAWTTATVNIPLPTSTTRTRYTATVVPQANTATTVGTGSIQVLIQATSDATTATQQTYTIYRASLQPVFSLTAEAAAGGERSGWWPLVDALSITNAARPVIANAQTVIEPASADRSSYKTVAASAVSFPYSAALSARGYLSTKTWTNLLKGSNVFGADWTLSNATSVANNVVSPLVGETVASATKLTATSTAGNISQATGSSPTNKSYVGGIWVKKISADAGNQAGTATFTISSTTVTGSGTAFTANWIGAQLKTQGGNVYTVSAVASATSLTLVTAPNVTESGVTFQVSDVMLQLISTSTKMWPYFLANSAGWQLLPINASFGGSDVATVTFQVAFGMPSASNQIAVASSYLYDINGNPKVLYPPVCQTPAGSTGLVAPTQTYALTAVQSSNVLNQVTYRSMISMVSGALNLTIVPTYDAGSQPDGYIFASGFNSNTTNLLLQVVGSSLILKSYDSASAHNYSVSLAMTTNSFPANTSVTWLKDAPIAIRVRWNKLGMSLSAGNGYGSSVVPGGWNQSDATVNYIAIGNDLAGANPFDGIVTNVESLQVGAPIV